MKTILRKIKIYGNSGYDEIKELEKQGFQEAWRTFCFSTLIGVTLWKNVP